MTMSFSCAWRYVRSLPAADFRGDQIWLRWRADLRISQKGNSGAPRENVLDGHANPEKLVFDNHGGTFALPFLLCSDTPAANGSSSTFNSRADVIRLDTPFKFCTSGLKISNEQGS
jgi:hypothetical protein